jgi:hypothetical protein
MSAQLVGCRVRSNDANGLLTASFNTQTALANLVVALPAMQLPDGLCS